MLLFLLLVLLFIIFSSFYMDEMRYDWELRRKEKHDERLSCEKRDSAQKEGRKWFR
jgi:hypothetical protein